MHRVASYLHYWSEEFILPGEQTILTDLVYDHADRINSLPIPNLNFSSIKILSKNVSEDFFKGNILFAYKTSKYIFENIPYMDGSMIPDTNDSSRMVVNRDLKEDFFHKRDIEEILIDGKLPTCSDLGILFRGLMIAQGISTSYVETFHEDFILKNKLHTHTFAKILKDNPYDDIDTSNPLSSNFYYFINPDFPMAISPTAEGIFPYIIFKEGLDSWDMDIRSHEDILSARDNDLENLLVSYRKNLRGKFDEKHFEYDEF